MPENEYSDRAGVMRLFVGRGRRDDQVCSDSTANRFSVAPELCAIKSGTEPGVVAAQLTNLSCKEVGRCILSCGEVAEVVEDTLRRADALNEAQRLGPQ